MKHLDFIWKLGNLPQIIKKYSIRMHNGKYREGKGEKNKTIVSEWKDLKTNSKQALVKIQGTFCIMGLLVFYEASLL